MTTIKLDDIPAPHDTTPQIGDLYAGGGKKSADYWLVVGFRADKASCVCLGLDTEGNVISSCNFYTKAMKSKTRLARRKLTLTWDEK